MNIQFAPAKRDRRVKIKVVGVGGAGGNAVDRMVEAGLAEVDFFAVNTDSQALEKSRAHQTITIGNRLTRGLGAGGDPEIGRQAAEEDRELLAALVEDTDMVFVTAGMGGGTGTGAAPLVAEVARQQGALTVAVVTRPFEFEGARRKAQAAAGLETLRDQVDALLVIPNERLMEIDVADGGMTTVFQLADNVLYEATRGITEIIAQQAVVNLDFADVRTVMKDSGAAIMGTGRAAGEGRARLAAGQAICSPLLENVDILGSRAVLVYLTAACVSRDDLREAMGHVQQAAGSDAHIFFGFANDESLGEDLQVTVIATGFPTREGVARPVAAAAAAPATVAATQEPATPLASAMLEEPVAAAPASAAAAPEVVKEEPWDNVLTCYKNEIYIASNQEGATPDMTSAPIAAAAPPPAPAAAEAAATPVVAARAEAVQVEAIAPAPPAAMVAAAGSTRDATLAEADHATPAGRRFLAPLGSVKLEGRGDSVPPAGSRFRDAARGEDLLRPAWERKYVD